MNVEGIPKEKLSCIAFQKKKKLSPDDLFDCDGDAILEFLLKYIGRII